jgi:hypothetical protein
MAAGHHRAKAAASKDLAACSATRLVILSGTRPLSIASISTVIAASFHSAERGAPRRVRSRLGQPRSLVSGLIFSGCRESPRSPRNRGSPASSTPTATFGDRRWLSAGLCTAKPAGLFSPSSCRASLRDNRPPTPIRSRPLRLR